MAAPLARTNEIVILSGDGGRITGEVNRLLAELPVSVNALTGVDLSKVSEMYYTEVEGHGNIIVDIFNMHYLHI